MNEENTVSEPIEDTRAAEIEENADTCAEENSEIETMGEAYGDEPLSEGDQMDGEISDRNEPIDYEALIKSDVAQLRAEFPELARITDVTDLNNPLRYAALRDLGLTPAEAYLATAKRTSRDTRAHLKAAHGRNAAASEITMSPFELAAARELFPGKNDAELQRLYKRVAK